MDLNSIVKGKAIPIGIIIIVISYLASGSSSSILPFMLFVGIIVGIMKNSDIKESTVAALITSLIGAFIALILSILTVYISYGSLYALAMVSYSLVYVIIYIIVGTCGGALGYYIYNEIDKQ
jgi:F0F1-type ATP synthase assembly protein I